MATVHATRAKRRFYISMWASVRRRTTGPEELAVAAQAVAVDGLQSSFDALLKESRRRFKAARWHRCDIDIDGRCGRTAGHPFRIFMLLQTYTGADTV